MTIKIAHLSPHKNCAFGFTKFVTIRQSNFSFDIHIIPTLHTKCSSTNYQRIFYIWIGRM